MELHSGHIHRPTSAGSVLATIEPMRCPVWRHLLTPPGQATEEPLPTDQMEVVPALRGFADDPERRIGFLERERTLLPGALLASLPV